MTKDPRIENMKDRAVAVLKDQTLSDRDRIWEATTAHTISTLMLGFAGFTADELLEEGGSYLQPRPIDITLTPDESEEIFATSLDSDEQSEIEAILDEVWKSGDDELMPLVVCMIQMLAVSFLRSAGVSMESLRAAVDGALEVVADVETAEVAH